MAFERRLIMPWKETCVMEQRVKFIMDALDGTYNMTDIYNRKPGR